MSITDNTIKPYNTIGLPECSKLIKDFNLNLSPSDNNNPAVHNSSVSTNKNEFQQRSPITSTSSVDSTNKNRELLSKIYAK